MPDFVRNKPAPEDHLPDSVKALRPDRAFLFSVLSREAAAHCLKLRALLPYSGLVSDPTYRPLGDPSFHAKRFNTPAPGGRLGSVADRLSFTYTPRNAVVYGSCGPTPPPGAHRFTADNLVIAALPLKRLLESGMSAVYCDRQPVRSDVEATDAPRLDRIPWDCIRDSRFGAKASPDEHLHYHAEVLVEGPMPVTMLTWAVPTEASAAVLAAQAKACGLDHLMIVVEQSFFFK